MHINTSARTRFKHAGSQQPTITVDTDALEVIEVGGITNYVRVRVNKGHDGSYNAVYFLCKTSKSICRFEDGDIKVIDIPEGWKQNFFTAIKQYLNNHVRERTYFEAMHIIAPNPS